MPLPKARLAWVDNLRTFIIALVVCQHACVTYSHVGDWYVMSRHEPGLAIKVAFLFWQGHLQAFFMGLLFFISGYFAHKSLSRRGAGAFLRERLLRLGLPTLLYMLAIHPFIDFVLNPWDREHGPAWDYYRHYVLSGRFIGGSGPLWFAFALLIFCTVLALWRTLRSSTAASTAAPAIGAGRLALFGLGLVLATFLIRTVQPIGTAVINFQLCFFPQYIAAFVAGIAAAQHGWLLSLAASVRARRAGWLALFGGPVALCAVLVLGRIDRGDALFVGGWHWQAAGLAAWEQLAGLGLALGLLALFLHRGNQDGAFARWLADRSFGVYVLHAPVLVALTLVLRPYEARDPFLLAGVLTLTGLTASYLLASVALRVPGLRRIL